jgi:uncharacterized membrane protein YtjA (UPF0391 family)
LVAGLTGVIPPRCDDAFGPSTLILFPRAGLFSSFPVAGMPGTFVPIADYFNNPRAACGKQNSKTEDRVMLSWVVTFLVVALVAGVLGFGGIAGVSIEIAKTIFFIAVVLFLISAVVGLARGRTNV